MRKTKKLTIEEYQSPTAYNKKADILKLVQFEEKLRVKTETPPLLKYKREKVAPLSAGVYNLVRQMLP